MDITGIRLLTVLDKDGKVLNIDVTFTAENAHFIALYSFHKKLSDKKQERVTDAIQKAKTLAKMKEKVRVIGREVDEAVTQKVSAAFNSLVPKGEGPAKIFIGKVEKDKFSVRLSIPQKKDSDEGKIVLEIPFKGVAGDLKGQTFDGEVTFLTEGTQDVAKVKLEIYNIGNSE
jgi:hypothetical protein